MVNPSKTQDEAGLISLLTYVENIESEIHQNPSDKRVAEIIQKNFSPDLLVDENLTVQTMHSFQAFNTIFRHEFLALKITDRKPVVFTSDPAGKEGMVGFATSWLFERKKDGKLFDGDTIEIFEVSWFAEDGESCGGHRLITKAFAAIGTMNQLTLQYKKPAKASAKKTKRSARVVSGKVSK